MQSGEEFSFPLFYKEYSSTYLHITFAILFMEGRKRKEKDRLWEGREKSFFTFIP